MASLERLRNPRFAARAVEGLDRLALREWPWLSEVNRWGQFRTLQHLFRWISRLGDGLFWYGLMAVMLLADGMNALPAVTHMILAGLCGTLLYKWLKHAIRRPRPYDMLPNILCPTAPLDRFSFPSGHTLHAVVFSLVAAAYYPVLAWLAFPFAALVAVSRLILGLHYPSDVLAGGLIGGLIALLSLMI